MKKLIIIVILFTLSTTLKAYENEALDNTEGKTKADTTRLNFGKNIKIIIISTIDDNTNKTSESNNDITIIKEKKYKPKKVWRGVDWGVAGYLTPQKSFEMTSDNHLFELDYSRSRTLNFNFSEKKVPIYKNYIGMVSGLGVSINRYHFNNRTIALTPYTDSLEIDETGILTKKHFLSSTNLTLPLLIVFNTHQNPKKSLHIATGVIGGYRIGARNVRVTEIDRTRFVVKDGFNLAPFNLSATVRLGYGNFINIFASYSLTEMFQKGKGPELNTFSAGLTLFKL